MHTHLLFSKQARQSLKTGIDILADAVKVTLGPQGRPVTIANPNPNNPVPIITKDGVTVANSVHRLEDTMENMGAQLVKAVARKTAAMAGDGTTTATLLAQVIISEGIKALDGGTNPIELKRGMDKAVENVVATLKKISRKVDNDSKEILNVATISANNDTEIGAIIADIIGKVGKDGLVTIEESKTAETYSKRVEGIQLERGYISPYFVTNPERMSIEFTDPLILLYDKKISNFRGELEPILTKVLTLKRPLLIIAEDVEGEALNTLLANVERSRLPVAAIRTPTGGLISKDILEDIAIITKGSVISETKGYKLSTVPIEKLGGARKVVITKDTTIITDGDGENYAIEQRAKQVRTQIEESQNDHEKQALEKRLAKLTNGVGIIYVGGQTEVEMKEKKDRVDDALCATLAAIEEGILPGGGIAYIKALQPLQLFADGLELGEQEGAAVIMKALQSPFMQILLNTGLEKRENNLKEISSESKGVDFGYNAKTMLYENFFETGVIDPTKVTRVALESAASIAGLVLLTECVMGDIQ